MTDPSASAKPTKRLFSALAVALGLAPGAVRAETPRSVAPQVAPQAWLGYARLVSEQVSARISSEDAAATRLRDDLNQQSGAGEPDGVTLRIAFWIDHAGTISRVDFPLFAQAQSNDDLKSLMVGTKLPQAPPKNMLLPLRLAVHVKPMSKLTPTPKPQAWTDRRSEELKAATVRLSYTASRSSKPKTAPENG
jgi:hypothetical protein